MPSLIYTIGLCHQFDHPEVMVFGLDLRTAHVLLRDVVDDLRAGKSYASAGRYLGLLEGLAVTVRPVHPTQHLLYLGYAMAFYRRLGRPEMLRTVQVLWPDSHGRAPCDVGCDPAVVAAQLAVDRPVPPDTLREFLERYRPVN